MSSQAVSTILAAYNTENLRHALMTYPTRIHEARQTLNQTRKTFKDAELERAMLEAELVLSIGTETDERGKPKYSNAEARNAELLRRKATDPRYLEVSAKVEQAEAAFNEAQDNLQMLLDEYQSLRYASRMVIAELSVISELADLDELVEVPGQNSLAKEAF